jgi:hypothetical protein
VLSLLGGDCAGNVFRLGSIAAGLHTALKAIPISTGAGRATGTEYIAQGRRWVVGVDLEKFFGSLNHKWVLRFVEHRVGDPRVISLIQRWMKAGVLEDGEIHPNGEGTPQGGGRSACCWAICI